MNNGFCLRWIEKRKHWRFYEIYPAVAELVTEQQKFLDKQFGSKSKFEKLFCKTSTAPKEGALQGGRFNAEPVLFSKINHYLNDSSLAT